MKAAQRLVDKRQGLGLGLQEQRVIVASHLAVESSQAFWSEVCCGAVVE